MTHHTYLILGCGYTGRRVAERLAASGEHVIATTRSGGPPLVGVEMRRLEAPGALDPGPLPDNLTVLHSIPLIESQGSLTDPTPLLIDAVLRGRARRIVYLSTTGVYGAQVDINEATAPAPRTPREKLRVEAEEAVRRGPWSSLILRPAAIYGPDRGAHVALARGTFRLSGDGANFVSRIHVDDLSAIATAALRSELEGSYPVADDLPCTSREIAAYCADLLGVELPPPVGAEELHETRRANRRVDGGAIRRLLAVELEYPSYREGIRSAMRRA